jgi:hypothetical protein
MRVACTVVTGRSQQNSDHQTSMLALARDTLTLALDWLSDRSSQAMATDAPHRTSSPSHLTNETDEFVTIS